MRGDTTDITTSGHYSHYDKRAAEICDESKQVVCEKVPVYQEEIKDVEVCQAGNII